MTQFRRVQTAAGTWVNQSRTDGGKWTTHDPAAAETFEERFGRLARAEADARDPVGRARRANAEQFERDARETSPEAIAEVLGRHMAAREQRLADERELSRLSGTDRRLEPYADELSEVAEMRLRQLAARQAAIAADEKAGARIDLSPDRTAADARADREFLTAHLERMALAGRVESALSDFERFEYPAE